MKVLFRFVLGILLSSAVSMANDGAYTMDGNHIVPTTESDISIKKEILSIKRVGDDILDVTVEYTLLNPKDAKSITVGFEAAAPNGGGIDGRPINGGHPYMKQFSVELNGENIPYKVATVTTDKYIKDGKIISNDVTAIVKNAKEIDLDFLGIGFVYYFNALFKKGENHLIHHYRYEHSMSVESIYEFNYILSTASRWRGNQIDDFTLHIDMGEYQEFTIDRTFFDSFNEWTHDGEARDITYNRIEKENIKGAKFYTIHKPISFHKKDFKITGDLILGSYVSTEISFEDRKFNYRKDNLAYLSEKVRSFTKVPRGSLSHKILRNHPYAKRGYVFKNQAIQRYYDKMVWYIPNPSYKASRDDLIKEDIEWLRKLGN